MHAYTRWALGTALLLGAACSPRDSAVKTTTADGESSKSASGDAAAARDHSMIRVVNAVTNGPQMTLLADEQTLFDNVRASEVTPFKEMDENAVKFSVRRTDQPTATGQAVNREMMGDGQRYTAVVLQGENGGEGSLRLLHDELTPAAGMASIRVIHAAPGTGEVDVVLSGREGDLFSGINYGNEGGYTDINPTTATLEVRRKNEKLQLVSIKDMKLEAGVAYTVVIIGGPKLPLKTISFEDKPIPSPAPVTLNQ